MPPSTFMDGTLARPPPGPVSGPSAARVGGERHHVEGLVEERLVEQAARQHQLPDGRPVAADSFTKAAACS